MALKHESIKRNLIVVFFVIMRTFMLLINYFILWSKEVESPTLRVSTPRLDRTVRDC